VTLSVDVIENSVARTECVRYIPKTQTQLLWIVLERCLTQSDGPDFVDADKLKALLPVVHKIPVFGDLPKQDEALVLQACEFKWAKQGEILYQVRQPSDDLSILLTGRLSVGGDGGVEIATIAPVNLVGEMGLFTGQPRSATVRAAENSNLLVLKKVAFERLMRNNTTINRSVSPNIIRTLHHRGLETMDRAAATQRELDALEAQLESMRQETKTLQGVAKKGEQ
jgi:CRP-like cAMP-binding protein